MRLLLDEHLSRRLPGLLGSELGEVTHLADHGLLEAGDADIWSFAGEHGWAIVSKDADFVSRAVLHRHPPQVVWVRLGNSSTAAVAEHLLLHRGRITRFVNEAAAPLLPL